PQEDAWIGKATERIFLAPIKMTMVPEILDMNMPVEGVFHNLVLTKIEKSFAGQAQKVMNAMWGAGQMMFNKILVITDESADLNQYEAVAKHVFKHLNAATDIYFSQGPMDVLDHSCSKMGFGGKMCIDGTIKHEEEISEETYQEEMHVSVAAIQSKYPEVKGINTALLAKDIACVIISVQKQQTHHVQKLTEALHADQLMKGIKMVLIVDASSDVNDISSCLWRVCNNFDPKRDAKVLKTFNQTHQSFATIYIDGTRKTKQHDLFQRDWPNAIVSDKATILAIDKKWASLGLGTLIDSPSLKYQDTVIGESAEVRES
ncbi:MAG TPA: UbiD family decarboxylase, partial [Chitinophagaceae bacterium]|nr:UbiD family decarboxylase [Chitinophagaceae bacterium]